MRSTAREIEALLISCYQSFVSGLRNISEMRLEQLKDLDSKVLIADEFVELILRNEVIRYRRLYKENTLVFKIEFF